MFDGGLSGFLGGVRARGGGNHGIKLDPRAPQETYNFNNLIKKNK